jgi:N-methylhydantoinase B
MRADPAQLEIFKHIFQSVAEEMGGVLRRSAFSSNIKERRDYSCAVFDSRGEVVAMGDHMPVHLGSMPHSVAAVLTAVKLAPGDIALLNDPFAGGTHLPDLTVVMPVYTPRSSRPVFYVVSRAHHTDIGGARAGSMALSREILEEGLRIPPVRLVSGGRLQRDVLAMILANVRTPQEREGDLQAQIAACLSGERRILALVKKYGAPQIARRATELLDYSERMMRATLREIPSGRWRAVDFLDDDGISPDPIRIAVSIRVAAGSATVDFSGTAPVCTGSVNAVRAITESAVFYVFRSLLRDDVPATSGLMHPIRIIIPPRSILSAEPPAAVAGGNVETSQRIVDVLLRALAKALPERIPAASQGTMNNVSFGGIAKALRGAPGVPFACYETIAGGMGGRPTSAGLSGVHTHMTNSLNTPIEALEHSFPVRVRCYALRRGTGGAGKHRGGNGIVREIEFLTGARGAILSDRRRIAPWGLSGGKDGSKGRNTLVYRGKPTRLSSKANFEARAGTILRVETPGGGGWGRLAGNESGRKGKQKQKS